MSRCYGKDVKRKSAFRLEPAKRLVATASRCGGGFTTGQASPWCARPFCGEAWRRRERTDDFSYKNRRERYKVHGDMSRCYGKDVKRRSAFRLEPAKKLVATGRRGESVYNRTDEPSVTFCGKEEQRNGRMAYFCKKSRSKADFAPTWRAWQDSNLRPTGS